MVEQLRRGDKILLNASTPQLVFRGFPAFLLRSPWEFLNAKPLRCGCAPAKQPTAGTVRS
jgi:hypothetical protein